jgi:hypothetical protein
MTDQERRIIDLARRVRAAQRLYFRAVESHDKRNFLAESKRLERELDAELQAYDAGAGQMALIEGRA